MKDLLLFFNGLDKIGRLAFCTKIAMTENFLRKKISTKTSFKEKTCTAIEEASNGAVLREDLRPDDWQEIWPELIPLNRLEKRKDAD